MPKNTEETRGEMQPELADCRASDIGMGDIGECLICGPSSCSYALPFGYCFLCRHPRLQEIISNTQKTDPLAAGIYER